MGNNPYSDPTRPGHRSAQTVGLLFAVGVPAILVGMLAAGLSALVIMGTFFAMWGAAVAYYALIPEDWFASGRIDPVLSHRVGNISRLSFMAIVYGALTAIDLTGYNKAWGYYGLYWLVPLFTSFPVFMILRDYNIAPPETAAASGRQFEFAQGNCSQEILVVGQTESVALMFGQGGVEVGAKDAIPQDGEVTVVAVEVNRVVEQMLLGGGQGQPFHGVVNPPPAAQKGGVAGDQQKGVGQ